MHLIVDIGNTCVKAALMEGDRIEAMHRTERLSTDVLRALVRTGKPARAIVSSTREATEDAAAALRAVGIDVLEFTPSTPVPIGIDYRTPSTLGRDRVAAAVGAAALYAGRNALVVDFGTALTVDTVTADGVFRGGFISPGLGMRFRALHDYTARLPLCGAPETILAEGDSTASAVEQGVVRGMIYEIEGHIRRMEDKFADPAVIFTGGDAKYFAKRIKNTIFADCDLVFFGLNRILAYNASEKTDR